MNSKRPEHPGKILKERFLAPLNITPYRLAKNIGVHVRRVSELVKGARSLTPDTALRLGLFFDVPPTWWLEMQAKYDAADEERIQELKEIVTPYEGLGDILVLPNGIRRLERSLQVARKSNLLTVSSDFEQRLRSQVAERQKVLERSVKTVTYSNGARALVGGEG